MPGNWFVLQDGKERGPFSREQLQELANRRKLTPGARVRKGTGPWKSASDVPGLFPWIDDVIAPDPAPVNGSRWKLGVVIGATALVSTVIAVVVCVVLLGGRGAPDPRDSVVSNQKRVTLPITGTPAEAEPEAESEIIELPPEIPDEPVPREVETDPPAEVVEESDADERAPSRKPEQPAEELAVVETPERPKLDPKPLLPAVPKEKSEITDEEIREFDRSRRLELTAQDAYARYEVFAQSFAFTDEQRERVDAELAEWKQRADEDQYRLGADWVTQEEVREAEQRAEELIARARALIEVNNIEACIEVLEDANRANPNAIKAPYLLGLIWSLPFAGLNGPDNAERYFRTVLRRHPNHAGALNSMAIAQIKQGDHGPALTNFQKSAELSEDCTEVMQNLGRFLFLSGSGRIRSRGSNVDRFGDLYATLLAEKRGPASNNNVGWLHNVPVFPESERDDERKQPSQVAARAETLVPAASGSGFVVAPGYVMTNRHVVYPESEGLGVADVVGIADPSDPTRELRGEVVAISDTADIALVHFRGLDAPVLRLRDEQVDLATEVMILGYPRGELFGTGIKATQGIVSALPDLTRSEGADSYLFDATTDQGNSGGPVMDADGNVIALLTFVYNIQARVVAGIQADFTGGVPSTLAAEFAEQHIPQYQSPGPGAEAFGNWADVTRAVAPSVLRLTVYYRAGVPEFQAPRPEQLAGVSSNVYEDATCPTCNGRTRLACPRRGCIGGEISIRYYETRVVGAGALKQVLRIPQTRKETCPVCKGANTLDCPDCESGFDAFLR